MPIKINNLFFKSYYKKRAFKYSRAANEQPPPKQQQQANHHGHAHGEHGHAHADHGHAHADHGHAHKQQQQQQKPAAHDHGHAHKHEEKTSAKKEQVAPQTKMSIALYASMSTLLISIAPFFILFFIPLNNNSIENQSLLKVLLAFASGSLLGDAFLHLIPHALSPHDHSGDEHAHSHESEHGHDHSAQTSVGLWILAGIMAFLIVEKVVRNLNGGESAHTHSHAAPPAKEEAKKPAEETPSSPSKRKDATKPAAAEDKKKSSDETDEKEKKCTKKGMCIV